MGKTRPLPGSAFNAIVQCVSHQFSFARPNEGKKMAWAEDGDNTIYQSNSSGVILMVTKNCCRT